MAPDSVLGSLLRQEIRGQAQAALVEGLGSSALREELAELRSAVERLAREQASPGERLIGLRQLQERLGIGRTSIYELMTKDASFPRPLQVLGNKLLWRSREIDDWICSRRPGRVAS